MPACYARMTNVSFQTKDFGAACVIQVNRCRWTMRCIEMKEDTDNSLAQKAAAGDRDAFALLLERHYGRIYRIGICITGHAEDAADLAQEICVSLPARLRSYRGQSQFTTWLYRVVVNAAHDWRRRQAVRQRSERDHVEESISVQVHSGADMSQSVWLRQVLGQLSEELRTTVFLVFEEGLRHAEAGEALGVSETTVSWRIHEVRKRLCAQAAEEGQQDE